MKKINHKRLLLIGSTEKPIHIQNFYFLIKDYFDEVLIVGTHKVDFCPSKTINFSIKNPIKVRSSIRELRKIMIDFNPTIVHVHQANTVGFITSLANKNRFPQVLTTWGDDVLINPYKNSILKKLSTTSLKYSNYVTADSQSMADSIAKFYKQMDVTIANFGIELFDHSSIPKENILYSNRLHNDLYNIDKIIDGCVSFLQKNSDWKLIIAGEGSNTSNLKQKVAALPVNSQINFVGFISQEENRAHYFKAKVYISIPNTDGTSISLLEALAYNCIPIVSDLPSNREWITDGKNGIVANNFDVEKALENLKDLDFKKVISLNENIIQERATKQSNREKFIGIYDSIVSSL